jgi:predicted neutral ceramidase superfamily lipid hydrolase
MIILIILIIIIIIIIGFVAVLPPVSTGLPTVQPFGQFLLSLVPSNKKVSSTLLK